MQRLVIFLILLFSISAFAESEGRLLRFPAIYDNQIVFTYAGDLYTVPAEAKPDRFTVAFARPTFANKAATSDRRFRFVIIILTTEFI